MSVAIADPQLSLGAYQSELAGLYQASSKGQKDGKATVLRVPSQYPTISAAVAAASAGSTIVVARGVYHESVVIGSELTGLSLLAESAKKKKRAVLDGQGKLAVGVQVEAGDVRVQGFAVTRYTSAGLSVPSGAGGIRLLRNTVQRITAGSGIVLSLGCGGCLLEGNRVSRCRDSGVRVAGKDHYLVRNSSARNLLCGFDVETLGNHLLFNSARRNGQAGCLDRQGNNVFYCNTLEANGQAGVSVQGLGGSLVGGNRISDNRQAGVDLASRSNVVLDNVVKRHAAGSGISASGSSGAGLQLVETNVVRRNSPAGVALGQTQGSLLWRNGFRRNYPEAVQSAPDKSNVVLENRGAADSGAAAVLRVPRDFGTISEAVRAAKAGDTVLVADGVYRESVRVHPGLNSLRILADGKRVVVEPPPSSAGATTGFQVTGASHVLVQGFRVRGFSLAGLSAAACLGPRFVRNRVEGVAAGDGIALSKTFSALVYDNSVSGCSGHGLSITGMNSWCLRNRFEDNGGCGILAAETNTFGNAIVDNVCRGNAADGIRDNAGPNLIMRNSVGRNKGNGINEAAGGQGFASILGNKLARNGAYGIYLGTDKNYLANNDFKRNKLGPVGPVLLPAEVQEADTDESEPEEEIQEKDGADALGDSD